jgi:hypothetical protein
MNVLDAEIGQTYGPYELKFEDNNIKDYLNCVTFSENKEHYNEYLPPFYVIALALSNLIEDIQLFNTGLEAVHSGQEVIWNKAIYSNTIITARSKLSSKKVIKKSLFLVFSVEYTDLKNEVVGSSVSKIILNEK